MLVPYGWHISKSTLFSQLIVLYHHAVSQYIRHFQVPIGNLNFITKPSVHCQDFQPEVLPRFLTLIPKIPQCSSLKILTNIKNTIEHQKCYKILWYLTIQKFATHEQLYWYFSSTLLQNYNKELCLKCHHLIKIFPTFDSFLSLCNIGSYFVFYSMHLYQLGSFSYKWHLTQTG